jgi:N-acyl-D-aspartate/D-glutamate deacylase
VLDIAIVGGEVIDGTGAPRKRADIGIKDGRIVQIGELEEHATRRLDAAGKVVTPGFIDVHTHYDAQVNWDPYLTPSPLHGVTTVIGGNCGFTLAPMEEEAVGYLTAMLARVEGIPLASVRAGVDITWRSFGQYLDTLEGNVGLNVGFLVGHSTVRRLVLGEDLQRDASDEEIEEMSHLVEESLAAGALGFSSSWAETHNDGAGDPTPSRFATEAELIRLSGTLRAYPGTWLEFIPWASGPFPDDRALLMAKMSAAAGRPLNWNLMLIRPNIPDAVTQNRLAASDLASAHGGAVFGLTMPVPVAMHLNLDAGFLFDSAPAWAEVLGRGHDHKISAFRDPATRQRLALAAAAEDRVWYDLTRLSFEYIESPAFSHLQGKSVHDAARSRGVDPFELLFEVAVADDLRTGFVVPAEGDDPESWRRRLSVWKDPRTIIGGSDAGAHLDMLDTFGYFTDFVGPTVRDRQLLPLEVAVRMVTGDAARSFGLVGRGLLAAGYAADIVIFDEEIVARSPAAVRVDLPGNGSRLYAEAVGIAQVLVNGQVIVEHGALTEALPGTVLRSGRDTETVAV